MAEDKELKKPAVEKFVTTILIGLKANGDSCGVFLDVGGSNRERPASLWDAYRMVCDAKFQLEQEIQAQLQLSRVAQLAQAAKESAKQKDANNVGETTKEDTKPENSGNAD